MSFADYHQIFWTCSSSLFFFYRKQLRDDGAVRAALKNCRIASLLPPVGNEFLRPFTSASLEQISQVKKEKEQRGKKKEQKVIKQTPMSTLSSGSFAEEFKALRLVFDWQVKSDVLPKPSPDLEEEKPLPFIFGEPSQAHLNTPLEELDPYHQSEVSVSSDFDQGFMKPFEITWDLSLWSPASRCDLTPCQSDLWPVPSSRRRSSCSVKGKSSTGSMPIRPATCSAPWTLWGLWPSRSWQTHIFSWFLCPFYSFVWSSFIGKFSLTSTTLFSSLIFVTLLVNFIFMVGLTGFSIVNRNVEWVHTLSFPFGGPVDGVILESSCYSLSISTLSN